jgi:hypothetical protein
MGHAIPRQQPAVVLRSHFNQLRALLAIALVAVAGLTTAIVILANDSDEVSSTSAAKPVESIRGPLPAQLPNTRYEQGTRGPLPAQLPNTRYEQGTRGPLPAQLPNTRYEQGTRGPLPAQLPNTRYDGGPEEGTRGVGLGGALGARYDGGPEEGSADVTPTQPRVTQQQAFPGLSREANGASADASPSQSGTKDYSMNGATGDTAAPPAAKSGSRADGDPDKGTPQSGPRP